MALKHNLFLTALFVFLTCTIDSLQGLDFKQHEGFGSTAHDDIDYNLEDDFEPLIIEGDIMVDPRRNAIRSDSERWPKGIVPYSLGTNYSTTHKRIIEDAMREIEGNVNNGKEGEECIKFVARDKERQYLSIVPKDGVCTSYVGYQKTLIGQEVRLDKACLYNGVIMHELIHSLGFVHEHSRPDRRKYVDIDMNNIEKDFQFAFKQEYGSRTLNTPYDLSSIMHYDAYAYSLDGRKPVMTPKAGKTVEGRMGQRWRMTETDVLKIQRLYKCEENTTHVKHPRSTMLVKCDFSTSMCGFTNDPKANFEWTLESSPTETGPYADSSTGKGTFLLATAKNNKRKLARVVSSQKYTYGKLCVAFYLYHGGTNGAMKVGLRSTKGFIAKDRNYANYKSLNRKYWTHINVQITRPYGWTSYNVLLEAYVFETDIAIDDLRIYEGKCYGL